MSFVTGNQFPESLFSLMSGVSRDGVREWPAELGETDDSDSLESRPPADVSSCSSMLKEGIGGGAALGAGLRRKDSLERLWRFELPWSELSAGGSGGGALVGGGAEAASGIV
jgi:hypothetical protein